MSAEVCLVKGTYDDAHDYAVELQEKTGATFIHPYDDDEVIAGQGTIGLEILDQLSDVDAVLLMDIIGTDDNEFVWQIDSKDKKKKKQLVSHHYLIVFL